MYQLTDDGAVVTADGKTSFVLGSGTRADIAYQAWVAAGNRPETAPEKPAPRYFLARDLIEHVLTADEIDAIDRAADPAIKRLRYMLVSRGDKAIDLDGPTAVTGIAALTAMFGDKRTQAITADMRLRAKP